MREFPVIKVESHSLRPPDTADAPLIVSYYQRNKEHFRLWEPERTESFYREDYWIARAHINRVEFDNDAALRLFLFEDVSKDSSCLQVLASISFFNFVRGAGHFCTLGFSIDSNREGQGLMRRCLAEAIPFVFSELKIHRIQANYMPHNRRSGNLLRRLGFVVEGYARDFLLIDGKWQDHLLTSLISREWTGRA